MNIRILTVVFDLPVAHNDLSAFRGAFAEKIGLEHEEFHNHNNAADASSGKKFHYRYPFVQYKSVGGKAAVLCIERAVESMQLLFQQPEWNITMRGKPYSLCIADLNLQEFRPAARETADFPYKISAWQALNAENYKTFKALVGIAEQAQFLEKILTANLLVFAKGINWFVEERVIVKITAFKLDNSTFKHNKIIVFDATFLTNISLPNGVGIGKGAAQGYGVIK